MGDNRISMEHTMTAPTVTPITSDAQWHELRAKNIGASEVAALFDASPWITQFMLWHQKAGKVPRRGDGDNRKDWGKRLEPVIAEAAAESLGFDCWRSRAYWSRPAEQIGCTLDFGFEDPEHGPAFIECKNVDWLVWKTEWGETRPPLKYQFQVQHQFAVTGRTRGLIACLVGGNELRLYDVRPQPDVIEEIRRRAAAFWESIRKDEPPPPDGVKAEVDLFKHLWPDVKGGPPITLDSMEVAQACRDLLWAGSEIRTGEQTKDRAQAIILNALEDHEHAITAGYRIKLSRSTNKNGVKQQRLTVKEEDTGVMIAPEDVRPFG